jgi:TATA-box binding protein (TBP) (component of TFIID and TFIIIB)
MWSGHGIIHRYNAHDIVLLIFQNGHMCRIDATLKIVSSFK